MQKQQSRKKQQQRRYDDLPEQQYGPGSAMLAQAPAELIELAEMEMDPEELAFRPKQLALTGAELKKKKSATIGFRKPAAESATKNKSLRSRASE
jgi:hypothetical protein